MPTRKRRSGVDRYRINLRLEPADEALLERLESATSHSRNELVVEALRHFYWSLLVKDMPVWNYLPPDVRKGRARVRSSPPAVPDTAAASGS